MKKNYGKPMITFESFALSGNIAGSCSGLIPGTNTETTGCRNFGTYANPDDCIYRDGALTLFYSNCDMEPQEGVYGNLCYHTSSEESRIFAS